MAVVSTTDTKFRLIEAVTKIVNEVPIVTEEDLAEVKLKIDKEVDEILKSDIHTYHTLEVMVTILNRQMSHGPVGVTVTAILWQRLVINKKIIMDKSSKGSKTFSSRMGHTPCRDYKFIIHQVPSLLTLSAKTVNKVIGKCSPKFCKTKSGRFSSADECRLSSPLDNGPNSIQEVLNLLFEDKNFLSEKLEIPLDCVQHLKKDFTALSQKYSRNLLLNAIKYNNQVVNV